MGKIGEKQVVKIADLKPYERNARTHSAEQVDQIAKSIEEFGFISPVLIDEDGNVIAGHGRIMAAQKLGLTEVPCLHIEGLTEDQRRAYILVDNRLTELGGWDEDILLEELEALKDADFDIDITGFEIDFGEPSVLVDDDDEYGDIDKLEAHYGVPYQGNKSRIADRIIAILPAGERLVDLFGGGGAITHCAILSNKWQSFLYNDLNEDITGLFLDAVYGKYHDERRVITREQFDAEKDTDAYIKYIWSFGNAGKQYLWGKHIENIKCTACHILLDETLNERRLAYVHFVQQLKETPDPTPNRLAPLERLQALTQLEALQRLEVSNIDYRDYKYRDGDVVYCDVPYEKVGTNKCEDYGGVFNSLEFYEWVKSRPYRVFFSSYEITDSSFYKKKVKSVMSLFGANTNGQKVNEYLYSNRPFEEGNKDA